MTKGMLLMLASLTVLLGGCQEQAQLEETMPICMDAVSMDHLFSTTHSVLTGMHFQIDKADRQARQIITRPLRGGQFFEFWRQDNATGQAFAESNLHSVQRIAEVRFDWADQQVCINCRVYVQRLSMPEQPIRGMSRASGRFTDSNARVQSLQLRPESEEQVEWIYFGNDPALEQVILRKVEQAIQKGSGS